MANHSLLYEKKSLFLRNVGIIQAATTLKTAVRTHIDVKTSNSATLYTVFLILEKNIPRSFRKVAAAISKKPSPRVQNFSVLLAFYSEKKRGNLLAYCVGLASQDEITFIHSKTRCHVPCYLTT